MYLLACLGLFAAMYMINTTIISIFYHRGLAHKAVVLHPWVRRFTVVMGIWLTGLDPKGWICMHRRHHEFSDAARDPHSPVKLGIFGVLFGQLRSYERVLVGLDRNRVGYANLVPDLDFPVNVLNRKRLWLLPYIVHLGIALCIAVPTGFWALGVCYFAGLMSHPIQGWMVNSLGHAVGGRNFDTDDNSRNNHLVAWMVVGEGFQNNHHQFPHSAKFSYRRTELDLGYGLCRLLELFGVLKVRRERLIPAFGTAQPVSSEPVATQPSVDERPVLGCEAA